MSKTKPTYIELNEELEAILVELQREDLDIDEALKNYERGLELVRQLERYLEGAENKVREIKAAFSASNTSSK